MVEKILTWFLTKILEYLFGKAEKATKEVAAQIEKEKQRDKVDEKNIIKYESAKDRKERIRASLHLINGTDDNAS